MEFVGDNASQMYGGWLSMEERMTKRFACDKRKMMMRKKNTIAQQMKWHDMVHTKG